MRPRHHSQRQRMRHRPTRQIDMLQQQRLRRARRTITVRTVNQAPIRSMPRHTGHRRIQLLKPTTLRQRRLRLLSPRFLPLRRFQSHQSGRSFRMRMTRPCYRQSQGRLRVVPQRRPTMRTGSTAHTSLRLLHRRSRRAHLQGQHRLHPLRGRLHH